MPCNCDYINASFYEIEYSKVLAYLEELKTGKLPSWHGNGYYEKVYNNTSPQALNEAVVQLCVLLQKLPKNKLSKMSLEIQLWWRDHQKADKKRIVNELKEKEKRKILAKETKDKIALIKRLTPYERKLLNVK